MSRLILLAALVMSAGCSKAPAPTPSDPVRVGPPFASLGRLEDASLPFGGEMAEGSAGDWLIQNERFSVVIRSLERRGGFSASGGNIIDAAPVGGNDVLREVFTYFDNTFPRQAVYDILGPESPAESLGVVLLARGRDSENAQLVVETRYRLMAGMDYLEIVTTLTNRGSETIVDFELGDAIEWGRAICFAPGPGLAVSGTGENVPFMVGYAEGTSYAWLNPEGDMWGPHGHAWSDLIVSTVDLQPGETASYRRRLLVTRGGPETAAVTCWAASSDSVGTIRVLVKDSDGTSLAGTRVTAKTPDGKILGWGIVPEGGICDVPVPPGDYEVDVAHPASGRDKPETVSIRAQFTETVAFELPEPAVLQLEARAGRGARSPARWTFVGLDDSPNPHFGPKHQITGAGNYVFTASGRGEVQIPYGRYRVFASRGPGFEAWEQDVDLDPGEKGSLVADLARIIPDGWVAADFHVHSLPSADCTVNLPSRAQSLVCEGLDWFAASDHGNRTEFSDVIAELDLAAPLNALVSEEITTSHKGHFGVFPAGTEREPELWNINSLDVGTLFDVMRQSDPRAMIQVNHPRAVANGYFRSMNYVRPDSASEEMRLDFDLLEIQNGKNQGSFRDVWKDWMGLLRAGHRVVGTGNSDSHNLFGQEVGYPRNYLFMNGASGRDAVLDAVREGRVVVSNGPFIQFTLEGEEVGSQITLPPGTASGHIRVIAPRWVDVSRVTVFVNGVEVSTYMISGRSRAVRFDEAVAIDIRKSAFVVVLVEGDETLDPIVPPLESGNRREHVRPLAFTNPIWVEVSADR